MKYSFIFFPTDPRIIGSVCDILHTTEHILDFSSIRVLYDHIYYIEYYALCSFTIHHVLYIAEDVMYCRYLHVQNDINFDPCRVAALVVRRATSGPFNSHCRTVAISTLLSSSDTRYPGAPCAHIRFIRCFFFFFFYVQYNNTSHQSGPYWIYNFMNEIQQPWRNRLAMCLQR